MVQTIVIIEDDADARTIFQDALAQRGYQVISAKHGAEGVTLARRHHADLILMDLRMPVMDGWQALRYLKADPRTSTIPVWALSAYLSEEEVRQNAAQMSFDRLLAKPMDPKKLVAEVEDYLGPPERRRYPWVRPAATE
jgi:CheY-like chemotaxis protein